MNSTGLELEVDKKQFRKMMKRYLSNIFHSKFTGDAEFNCDNTNYSNKTDGVCALGKLLKELHDLVESEHSFSKHAKAVLECIIEIRCRGKREEMRQKIRNDYTTFLDIRKEREQRIEEKDTASCRGNKHQLAAVAKLRDQTYWGTRQQMRSGKVVGDFLGGLDPVFGVLLNVTGGRIGRGDTPWFHNLLFVKEFPLAYHSAVHDAFGYLLCYHGKGPGYNYLKSRWTLFGTASPLSCQLAGINFWKHVKAKTDEASREVF